MLFTIPHYAVILPAVINWFQLTTHKLTNKEIKSLKDHSSIDREKEALEGNKDQEVNFHSQN